MKNRHKNMVVACSTLLVVAVAIGIALHLKDAANETKEVAKDEVRKTGDHVRDKIDEKIDKSSAQIANDYNAAKEITKSTATAATQAAKNKYNEWKQKKTSNK